MVVRQGGAQYPIAPLLRVLASPRESLFANLPFARSPNVIRSDLNFVTVRIGKMHRVSNSVILKIIRDPQRAQMLLGLQEV